MRFLYVISFVVLCGVIDRATGRTELISGRQIDTKIYPGQDLLSTKTPITSGQNVTWHKSFDRGVLFFGGEAQFERENKVRNVTLDWNEKYDMCEELRDRTLANLVRQVLRTSWLPTDHCPVAKGTYRLRNPFGPVNVRVPNVLNTKWFVFKLDVGYSKSDLVFSTTYEIEVLKIQSHSSY